MSQESFSSSPTGGVTSPADVIPSPVNDEETVTVYGKDEAEKGLKDLILVDFLENDPRNPFYFPKWRKWSITFVIVAYTGFTAACGSTFSIGGPSMMRDLNCSELAAAAGLGLYAFGFALAPLVLASFSEEFGRNPIYIISTIIFWLAFLPVALAKNINTVLIFRFISGAAGSTGSTMVGGSLADIWVTSERGHPMALFGFAAFFGTGLGPILAGWIEANKNMEWRWIQWLHFITSGVFTVIVALVLKETRGSVILAKEAARLRKTTGDERYRPAVESPPLKTLITISLTRPLHLLLTEPVVAAFSLWVGFAWGVLYGLLQSVSGIFQDLYGFNTGQGGSVFATVCVGSILGFASNWYQERLYSRYVKQRGPEARLYAACMAGVLLPIGCFIYAWTSDPQIHWVAPCTGIVIMIWAIYIIYAAVFNYLADCYLLYASSALAGQSLCRNLAGAAFPLFTNQMYRSLSYKWASTLFGCISAAMGVIPFILFIWGPKIRARSRFARHMAQSDERRTGK